MSSRGRVVWSSVTLAVLIGLSGACGSSKSYTAAKNERSAQAKAAAAAKAKIANAKRQLALAQQRAAAQKRAAARRRAAIAARKAAIAKRLQENRRRAQAGSTTTTTPITTPTTVDPAPGNNVAGDLAAVQATLDRLNRAFRAGVAEGIAASETANYWVTSGVYSADQCAAFEAKQGGGVVKESLSIHSGSFRADPDWIDPRAGTRPVGRVYAMVVDDLQTLVPSGEQRRQSASLHATVRDDGRALLFLRCS